MARTSTFSQTFRLKTLQINHAFTQGRRIASCAGMKVLFAISSEQPAKVLIVPTRALKGHVKRNKLRRQVKAIVYEQKLAHQTGTFIILLYPQSKQIPFEQMKRFLVSAFTKQKNR